MLYKGISNASRVYERPVFFTFSRNYAQQYALARLGAYAVARPLKLLNLTRKTIKYLIQKSNMNQLNKNRLTFITGINMTVNQQIQFVNKITQNENRRRYYKTVMQQNIVNSGARRNGPGGRKSFQNIDLIVYKALCSWCRANGYDGIFVDELRSPFHHPMFGSELALCDPKNALVAINFPLKNNN